MKVLRLLAVFLIAGLMISGCKGQNTSKPGEAPAPLGAGDEGEAPQSIEELDIGQSHTMPKTDVKVEKIEKATGGYTVEEIYTKKAELSGKEVTVKGKVVKFSAGIMGANWAHIQDGTGDSVKGSNDLTVTTQGTVDVDSTVTVKGILTTDKDFGAGYKYSVIIENAEIVTD